MLNTTAGSLVEHKITKNKRKAALVEPENIITKAREDELLKRLNQVVFEQQNTLKGAGGSTFDRGSEESSIQGNMYGVATKNATRRFMDDMGMQTLPKKRQRYQRRNSFVIHRNLNKSLLASASSILDEVQAMHQSTPDFKNRREVGEVHALEMPPPPRKRRDCQQAESSEDLTRNMFDVWGNASWATSDDTQWYSRLSALSFDALDSEPHDIPSSSRVEARTSSAKKDVMVFSPEASPLRDSVLPHSARSTSEAGASSSLVGCPPFLEAEESPRTPRLSRFFLASSADQQHNDAEA